MQLKNKHNSYSNYLVPLGIHKLFKGDEYTISISMQQFCCTYIIPKPQPCPQPVLTNRQQLNITRVNYKSSSDQVEHLSPDIIKNRSALMTSSFQISLDIRSSVLFAIFPIYSYLNGLQDPRPTAFQMEMFWDGSYKNH